MLQIESRHLTWVGHLVGHGQQLITEVTALFLEF